MNNNFKRKKSTYQINDIDDKKNIDLQATTLQNEQSNNIIDEASDTAVVDSTIAQSDKDNLCGDTINDTAINAKTDNVTTETCTQTTENQSANKINIENDSEQVSESNILDSNEQVSESELSNEQQNDEIIKENPNCKYDKKKDEKLKNLMTYTAIPFILVAIGFSLFNIGRVRYPFSFLFLALGIGVMAVFSFIRSKKIAKDCNCKVCTTASKSAFKYSIVYLILALGLLGVFIYFMVTGK